MKESVYIETSVISYLTSRPSRDTVIAAHQELTRQWWTAHAKTFHSVVSELVRNEAAGGDKEAASARLVVIDSLPFIAQNDAAIELTEALVVRGPIPKESAADAMHIALAAVHGIDYLLTWNCKHLANAVQRNRIVALVESAGYACPVICTPEELMEPGL